MKIRTAARPHNAASPRPAPHPRQQFVADAVRAYRRRLEQLTRQPARRAAA